MFVCTRYISMTLCLLLMVVSNSNSVFFTRCQLARALLKTKIINKTFLSSYFCLAEQVSNRDTSVLTEKNGKKFYGLYQIPQKWCKEKKRGGDCNVSCECIANAISQSKFTALLSDDIKEATQCASLIVKNEGFKYWPIWDKRCKDDLKRITDEIYKCPDLPLRRSYQEIISQMGNATLYDTA